MNNENEKTGDGIAVASFITIAICGIIIVVAALVFAWYILSQLPS